MLRKEIETQGRKIQRIEQKVTHQSVCHDCFEDKYYALLRVTSPN